MTLWSIWRCKNDKLWEGIETQPQISFSLTMQYLNDWTHARPSKNQHHNHPQLQHIHRRGFVSTTKLSWNGCLYLGPSWQIYHMQQWQGIYSTGISSPREAEAEGLVQALQWVQRLHLSNINFEVDCKNVVDFVLNRKRQLLISFSYLQMQESYKFHSKLKGKFCTEASKSSHSLFVKDF